MKFFVVLVTFLATAGAFSQNWITNPANGHRYALTSSSNFSWADAEQESIVRGGHLASVTEVTEELWLKTTFGTDWFWIGLTDQTVEGQWQWTSGELLTYTDWNPGEPNNQLGSENWAGMTWPQNPGWNDFPDWYRMYGVTEAVPEPATMSVLALGLLAAFIRRRNR